MVSSLYLDYFFSSKILPGVPLRDRSKNESKNKDLIPILVDSVFCADSEYDISVHTCSNF